jgi:hypothetical protein
MVILIPYDHTGLLGGLNQHQSHQSLQYFTKVLDVLDDRNIICDHIDRMQTLAYPAVMLASRSYG